MSYRDQEQVLEYAESQVKQGKRCVVCCWGDLNVSARELLERVRRRADTVSLVPGISSVQVAMARTGISLEDAVFITLHKRADSGSELEELVHYINEGRRHVILLPRPFDLMPAGIAEGLIREGVRGDLPVRVYQRLTFDDEKRWTGHLQGVWRDLRRVQRPLHHGLLERRNHDSISPLSKRRIGWDLGRTSNAAKVHPVYHHRRHRHPNRRPGALIVAFGFPANYRR